MNTSYSYIFPKIIDPDYDAKTSVSAVLDSETGVLPSFITFKRQGLTILSKLKEEAKDYKMKVIITDNKDIK